MKQWVTQRQIGLGLLGLMVLGALITLVSLQFEDAASTTRESIPITVAALFLLVGLFIAYLYNWRYAPEATVCFITLLSLFQSEPFLTQQFSQTVYLAPVAALILLSPAWIFGTAIVTLAGLLIRAGGTGIYTDPLTVTFYLMIIGSMILARIVTENALARSENNAREAREALVVSEQRAQEIASQSQELSEQNTQQRKLIELVTVLETPAITLAEGVLLVPIVGHLDSRRAERLTSTLLRQVSDTQTKRVILDLAGVTLIDTAVAQALMRAIQALRLLGCEVTVTGISAAIAATMTQLNITMAGITTARTPQEAILMSITPTQAFKRGTN